MGLFYLIFRSVFIFLLKKIVSIYKDYNVKIIVISMLITDILVLDLPIIDLSTSSKCTSGRDFFI